MLLLQIRFEHKKNWTQKSGQWMDFFVCSMFRLLNNSESFPHPHNWNSTGKSWLRATWANWIPSFQVINSFTIETSHRFEFSESAFQTRPTSFGGQPKSQNDRTIFYQLKSRLIIKLRFSCFPIHRQQHMCTFAFHVHTHTIPFVHFDDQLSKWVVYKYRKRGREGKCKEQSGVIELEMSQLTDGNKKNVGFGEEGERKRGKKRRKTDRWVKRWTQSSEFDKQTTNCH